MIDLKLLSKRTSALATIPNISETKLATQEVASSSCNERASAEREVTPANKETRPASGQMVDESTLRRLPSNSKTWMGEQIGLKLSAPLHAELRSQLAGPCSSLSPKFG